MDTIRVKMLEKHLPGEPQEFVVGDPYSRWDGGKLAYCLQPGTHAIKDGWVSFEVEAVGSFNECTHFKLSSPTHQDLYVLCQTVEGYESWQSPLTTYIETNGECSTVPIPSTLFLFGSGLLLLAMLLRRRK